MNVRAGARGIVSIALAETASCFPDLGPASQLPIQTLSSRDARLAVAIHRTVLQRWITLEYLLDLSLRKPSRTLEPRLRGVLLSAAAQILFFDRLPVHAVVHESVDIARRLVRPGAASLVNAVLRRFHDQTQPAFSDEAWGPAKDRLPCEYGSIVLCNQLLPDPANFSEYLSVATSHPCLLIQRWIQCFGEERATALCRHGLQTSPIIAVLEDGVSVQSLGADAKFLEPHDIPGFMIWRGGHDRLVKLLGQHEGRRVQDPASARSVQATAHLQPKWCLDYCAGRGTKTRQVSSLHPNARVIATDRSIERLADLRAAFVDFPAVSISELEAVRHACPAGGVDLLILDVPCSNTGVLARRPEARYRFNANTLRTLVQLQRRIIESAIRFLRPGGYLLYSTCSLEKQENEDQAAWIVQRYRAELMNQQHTLPSGSDAAYHDGSYYVLLKV